MPYKEVQVEPEEVVSLDCTIIYRTYKYGDIEQPCDYHYSYNNEDTDADSGDGCQFDIRDMFCYADTPPVTCSRDNNRQEESHKAILMELLEKDIIDCVNGIVIPKDEDGKLRTRLQKQISDNEFSGALNDRDLVVSGKLFENLYTLDGGSQMIPAPDGLGITVNVTISLVDSERKATVLELRGITIPFTGEGDERKADLSFLRAVVIKEAEAKLAQLSLELE